MEITNEIRAKVFAQYLGQRIILKSIGKSGPHWICTPSTILNINVGLPDYDGVLLCLKPISSISTYDAGRIAGNMGFEFVPTPYKNIKDFVIGIFTKSPASHKIHPQHILDAVDDLREHGYDIKSSFLDDKTFFEAGLAVYE